MARNHSGRKTLGRVTCPLPGCGQTVSRLYDMRRHITDIHAVKRFYCPIPSCIHEGANRRYKIENHIRNYHRNTRVWYDMHLIRPRPITQSERDLQVGRSRARTHNASSEAKSSLQTYTMGDNSDQMTFADTLASIPFNGVVAQGNSDTFPASFSLQITSLNISSLQISTYGEAPRVSCSAGTLTELQPQSIPDNLLYHPLDTASSWSFTGSGEASESDTAEGFWNSDMGYTWSPPDQSNDAFGYDADENDS